MYKSFYIKNKLFLAMLAITVLFTACKKDDDNSPDASLQGELTIDFNNVVGSSDLVLSTQEYTNAAGETYKIDIFNYYISNIKLTNLDGSEYVLPKNDSYFLIKESNAGSQKVKISVPEGDYTAITFTIGIDSTKSVSDVSERTGVLDVASPDVMYWNWNTGYIFMMLEGTSQQSSNDNKLVKYHIGLYGGYDPNLPADAAPRINNVKTVSIPLGNERANVRSEVNTMIHLKVDANKLFEGGTTVRFADNPIVMVSPFSKNVANNYVNAFSLDFVHNNAK